MSDMVITDTLTKTGMPPDTMRGGSLKLFSGSAHPALTTEIAEVLGVPEGTARSRVRRALEAVRAALTRLDAADLGSTVEDLDGWAASLGRLRALVADGAA